MQEDHNWLGWPLYGGLTWGLGSIWAVDLGVDGWQWRQAAGTPESGGVRRLARQKLAGDAQTQAPGSQMLWDKIQNEARAIRNSLRGLKRWGTRRDGRSGREAELQRPFWGSDAARVGKSEVVVRGEAGLGLALYRAERVGEEVAKAVEARSVVTSIKARWGGHFGRCGDEAAALAHWRSLVGGGKWRGSGEDAGERRGCGAAMGGGREVGDGPDMWGRGVSD
jgi:hypothetical protein